MKILLVEDDLEISKLLAEFLQENGYEIVSAAERRNCQNSIRGRKTEMD